MLTGYVYETSENEIPSKSMHVTNTKKLCCRLPTFLPTILERFATISLILGSGIRPTVQIPFAALVIGQISSFLSCCRPGLML